MRAHFLSYLFGLIIITVTVYNTAYAEDDYFDTINLQVKGNPIDYSVTDLNEDGFKDLLVSHLVTDATKKQRCFSVFYQTASGFPAAADQTFIVDEGAIIYEVADIADAPGKEIVFIKNGGVFFYQSQNGKYQQDAIVFLKTDSLFRIPDATFLEHFDFIKDINNDGIEEILIPRFNDYLLYYQNSRTGHYELKSKLNVSMFSKLVSAREVSRYLVSSYAIPNMIITDYNNDQRNDIIFVQESFLQVFYQSDSGTFSDNNTANIDFGIELTQAYSLALGHRSRFQRNRLRDKIGINTLRDLNNDGLLDIIIERFSFSKAAFNPKKKFYIFFGNLKQGQEKKGGYFNSKPDQLIVSRGIHINSWVHDLNNDNRLDIIIPAVEIGLFKIISILVTGSVDVTAYTYLMNADGLYPLSPSSETTYAMKFNRKNKKIPVEDFSGDYNGDGRKDFLGSKGETLFVTFGPENGNLEISNKNIEFEFELPSNGMNVKPALVNPDSKSDLVILYPDKEIKDDSIDKNICILMTK